MPARRGGGRVVAPGDHEAQARQALDNLTAALTAADRASTASVYVVARDRSELVRTWNVVAETFAATRPPSTLLGVALLG